MTLKRDVLSGEKIKELLAHTADIGEIHVLNITTSTNAVLKEEAQKGTPEGTCVIAGAQTAGRGRLGRKFFSPEGGGIYLSLLLRPKDAKKTDMITVAAAVAVSKAIESVCGLDTGIKWVNDIFINGKKVCGILTEGSADTANGGLEYAVLGVGINVYEPEGGFPEEISGIAGALFKEKRENLRNRICAAFLRVFMNWYKNGGDIIGEYRSRCFILGREITVKRSGSEEPALALDLDDNCRLLVRYLNGNEERLHTGEISIGI